MRRLLADRSERGDAGFSLIEMVVAVAVLGVVITAAFTTLDFFQSEAVTATNGFTAVSQGQLLIEQLGKDIRAAVALTPTTSPFTLATASQMTLYSNLGDPNGPTKLNIYLTPTSGSNLIEGDATPADPGSAPNWTYTGASHIQFTGKYVNTAAAPLFTYFDQNGNQLTSPVSSLTSIKSVTITLTTQVTPQSAPTTIATTLNIRNVDYNPNT